MFWFCEFSQDGHKICNWEIKKKYTGYQSENRPQDTK